jgi:hypothetical protein
MATDKLPHDRAAIKKATDPHSSAEDKLGGGGNWATVRITSQPGTEEFEQAVGMYTAIGYEVDPDHQSFGTVLRAPIDVARAKKLEWQRLAESKLRDKDRSLSKVGGAGHRLIEQPMNSLHSIDAADLQTFLEEE